MSTPDYRLGGTNYQKGENHIVEDTLELWKDICKRYKVEGKLLIWPSQPQTFGPGEVDITFTICRDKGIIAVSSLVDGRFFKIFEKLKRELNLENWDLYRYLQLRHFYDIEMKEGISAGGNEVIDVFTMACKHTPEKHVSKLYSKWNKFIAC